MKFFNPRVHGYLDYAVVAWFLAAPSVFSFSGLPAIISYTLSVVHFLVTFFTAFPLGMVKIIPLNIHGAIEFVVSFTLVALPWLLGFASMLPARNFYIASGVAIFIVWLITDYQPSKHNSENMTN